MNHPQENRPSLVIVGGHTPVGRFFMRRLAAAGIPAESVSRRTGDVPAGIIQTRCDLIHEQWSPPADATIISFVPVWILEKFLPRFTGVKTIIATSSTSRFSKADSADTHDHAVAVLLAASEDALQAWTRASGAACTILRPTLIYDCVNDINITRMARFIRRWRFLPVAAPATGLRQPIHADDVAGAAFKCLGNAQAMNRDFNISGGEVLSYRDMAARVFVALGLRPRFLMLPTSWLQNAVRLAGIFGFARKANFTSGVFQRMNQDLIFPDADGAKILDYNPRAFAPDFHAADAVGSSAK